MHDRMLPALHEPSLIRKMFGCCPGKKIHQISSPKENIWSMVAERLALHHTPFTAIDELWNRLEAAWASVPVYSIESLFNSMVRCVSAVITAIGGCSRY
ncbi:hypothetical protein TNCV_1980471 [Trichonephila clavipes]|nr:hypothetical protein TNCV_1980471 [Trichonephila clavipes]